MDITKPKVLNKDKPSVLKNKKVITSAVIATTATAAGTALVTTNRGRRVINDIVKKNGNNGSERSSMLTTWLRDAHAMEDAQIRSLKGLIKDFKNDKEIHDKLRKHLTATEKQKKDVEKCLISLGEKPAKSKELMGRFIGLGGSLDAKLFKDKKVKNLLVLHSAEHFEHISYMALTQAAKAEGKKSIATTMERISKEEKEMADWVEKHIGGVVKQELRFSFSKK